MLLSDTSPVGLEEAPGGRCCVSAQAGLPLLWVQQQMVTLFLDVPGRMIDNIFPLLAHSIYM